MQKRNGDPVPAVVATPETLAALMVELADPARPIAAGKLAQLADLRSEPLRVVVEGWLEVPDARRLDVLANLIEIGEDNVELDFTSLFKAFLADESAEVRAKAIGGLWECEERSLIDVFVRLLEDDEAEPVRAAAAQALGRFVLLAETGKLRGRDGERLASVLFDVIDSEEETIEVRRRAIEAIAPMSDERVTEIVRDAYNSEAPDMRASAVYAMGLTADPDWVPILIEEMDSDDPQMRYEAAVALGEIGEEETVPRLGQLIEDDDPMVQAAAINAIGNIGGEQAKRILENALHSDDERIAELAELALDSADIDEDPMNYQGLSRHKP